MKCPICEESEATEQHHHSYDPEVTMPICRTCHLIIHDGKRASEQAGKYIEGECWKTDAGNNLVGLHEHYHGRADSWDNFFERYNLPKQEGYLSIYELDL